MPRKQGQPTKKVIRAFPDGTIAITVRPGKVGAKKFTKYMVFRIANLMKGIYFAPRTRKLSVYKRHLQSRDGFVYASIDQFLAMLLAHAQFANESIAIGSQDKAAINWPFPADSTAIAYEATIKGMVKLPPKPPASDEEVLDLVRKLVGCSAIRITKKINTRVVRYLYALRRVRRVREKMLIAKGYITPSKERKV